MLPEDGKLVTKTCHCWIYNIHIYSMMGI